MFFQQLPLIQKFLSGLGQREFGVGEGPTMNSGNTKAIRKPDPPAAVMTNPQLFTPC